MNTAVFTIWLLLSMHSGSGKIDIVGQHWTEKACEHAKSQRPQQGRLQYHCAVIVIPEPKP